MRLRTRLVAAALISTVPTALALSAYDAYMHRQFVVQMLVSNIYRSVSTLRSDCEAAPAEFGGQLRPPRPPGRRGPPDRPRRFDPFRPPPRHGPGVPQPGPKAPRWKLPTIYTYDLALRSSNPQAPQISTLLYHGLKSNEVAQVAPLFGESVEVLVQMPWRTGPCAVAYGKASTRLPQPEMWLFRYVWILPALAMLLAILLTMGPVVTRIRRLTRAVQQSGAKGYTIEVSAEGKDEITELATAFRQASREVRTQLEARARKEATLRDFVANTMHDLMTPLSVLKGNLSQLKQSQELSKEGSPLGLAMNQAQYIGALVQNLSIVARLEGEDEPLHWASVDLVALVERVAERYRPIADSRQVQLEIGLPSDTIYAQADITLLERALSNLVDNAVRYNQEGGHVAVTLDKEDEHFVLRVLDDGPGIDEAELAQVKKKGTRGNEARTRSPAGQGLGLNIVCRVLELHNYQFTLQASDYGGAEAIVRGKMDQ